MVIIPKEALSFKTGIQQTTKTFYDVSITRPTNETVLSTLLTSKSAMILYCPYENKSLILGFEIC